MTDATICDIDTYRKPLPTSWVSVLKREASKVYALYDALGVQLDARAMCLRQDMLVQMLELLQIQRLNKGE